MWDCISVNLRKKTDKIKLCSGKLLTVSFVFFLVSFSLFGLNSLSHPVI